MGQKLRNPVIKNIIPILINIKPEVDGTIPVKYKVIEITAKLSRIIASVLFTFFVISCVFYLQSKQNIEINKTK